MAYYRPYPAPDPEWVKRLTEEQEKMRQQVRIEPLKKDIKTIAGCDSAFLGETIVSVFVVLSYPELIELEVAWNYSEVTVPYVPGFLAFREAPNLLLTFDKLKTKPDLIMVDGHGIAHPRRMGIAAHLGVRLNCPTMGVAKQVLVGKYEDPGMQKRSTSPLRYRGEQIGTVIRTRDNVQPVYVSPGHLCDQESATEIALTCAKGYKLPEPTRLADRYAAHFKKEVPQ
jgi:deoxyribonuclease V